MPRLAWPSSIALLLVLRERRAELDSTERVQRDGDDRGARGERLAVARVHLHLSVAAATTAATGVASRRSNAAASAIAASSAPVPLVDRHPASGELGELEAVARQRVPAQDRHGARLGERAVGDRLELGGQHVALLLVELELGEPLGDRQPIEPRELGEAR